MKCYLFTALFLVLSTAFVTAAEPVAMPESVTNAPATLADCLAAETSPPVTFEKIMIADTPFESACAFDVDRDGNVDIVSGEFWYAGPDFKQSHKIWDILAQSGYHDDFHEFPIDVNRDGHTDIITGGWFGKTLRWLENPQGKTDAAWVDHVIDQPGPIESSRIWDVDGDAVPEVVPNAAGNIVFYRMKPDAPGEFTKHVVKMGGCRHGLGFGDVNGDGRGDFVIATGWFEAPENPLAEDAQWTFHADFESPELAMHGASVPILVFDVNRDGLNDLIVGDGHGVGLQWYEQKVTGDGARSWGKHAIDMTNTQFHDLMLADLDGDGNVELISGKRYHAHNGKDPGAELPVLVRYYTISDDGTFTPHTVDIGPAAEGASGVGINFCVADVNGDDRLDIVAPGKEGLYLFVNEGAGDDAAADEEGFISLFDGRSLEGWDGSPKLWKVEDGAIVGTTSDDDPLTYNQFLIYRKATFSNFVMRFEYHLTDPGNSGIQYRSWENEDPKTPFSVGGYQADFDGPNRYSGILYGEQFRGILANRGQKTTIGANHKPTVDEQFGVSAELGKVVKSDDWNEYEVTADGFTFTHKINGQVMSQCTDDDVEMRRSEGIIAIQVHRGPAMQVKIRNLRIKPLK